MTRSNDTTLSSLSESVNRVRQEGGPKDKRLRHTTLTRSCFIQLPEHFTIPQKSRYNPAQGLPSKSELGSDLNQIPVKDRTTLTHKLNSVRLAQPRSSSKPV